MFFQQKLVQMSLFSCQLCPNLSCGPRGIQFLVMMCENFGEIWEFCKKLKINHLHKQDCVCHHREQNLSATRSQPQQPKQKTIIHHGRKQSPLTNDKKDKNTTRLFPCCCYCRIGPHNQPLGQRPSLADTKTGCATMIMLDGYAACQELDTDQQNGTLVCKPSTL